MHKVALRDSSLSLEIYLGLFYILPQAKLNEHQLMTDSLLQILSYIWTLMNIYKAFGI